MSVASLDEKATALRAVGFTADAVKYPRGELALRMLAAFNGVTTDKLPEGFRYFPNEATQNQGRWPAGSVWLWALEEVWSPATK